MAQQEGPTLIERNEQPFLVWDSSNDPMKGQDRFMERVVVQCIDVGILLEKRRMILEEIDAIDRRAKSFRRNPRTHPGPMRSLDKDADRLEIQIRRLEEAVRKDRAQLTSLISRK